MEFDYKRIFGKHEMQSNEALFRVVSFFAALFTVLYIFYDFFIDRNQGIWLINFIAFLGFSLFFGLSRNPNRIKNLILPFILFTMGILGIAWFYIGGSMGPMPFLYQLGLIAFILIVDTRYHFYVFFFVLLNLIIVNYLEYYFESRLGVEYIKIHYRQLDVFSANFMSIIFIGILISTLRRNYTREKEMVKEQNDKLEIANETKSRFMANMSHEIRTPLNGMLGMAVVLGKTPLNARQNEYLNAIEVSGDRLLNVINEILDYSKIEAGEMRYAKHPFSLYQCIIEVLDITASKAFAKDLGLAYWIDEDVPPIIIGDFDKLRQILLNLVGNGIKFTEEGEVYVSVSKKEEIDGKIRLLFTIKDTGIGIGDEDMEFLFESFLQLDNTNRRMYGGSGLGLAICKQFINNMGGDIWVESEMDKGSTFYFELLVKASYNSNLEEYEISKEKLSILAKKRILIVESNKTNRLILEKTLALWDMQVFCARGSQEALALAFREDGFDLALIDYKLPSLNGLELGIEFQKAGYDFPMVLLDAHNNFDIEKINDFFRFILLKPIKRHKLFEVIVNSFSDVKFDFTAK